MGKVPRRYGTGFVRIPYRIPYTDTVGEEDDLEEVSFMVKMTTLINFTDYIPKVIGIHAYFTYPYNTRTNTAVKIDFKTADGTGTGPYIRYPYPPYVRVRWASQLESTIEGVDCECKRLVNLPSEMRNTCV